MQVLLCVCALRPYPKATFCPRVPCRARLSAGCDGGFVGMRCGVGLACAARFHRRQRDSDCRSFGFSGRRPTWYMHRCALLNHLLRTHGMHAHMGSLCLMMRCARVGNLPTGMLCVVDAAHVFCNINPVSPILLVKYGYLLHV